MLQHCCDDHLECNVPTRLNEVGNEMPNETSFEADTINIPTIHIMSDSEKATSRARLPRLQASLIFASMATSSLKRALAPCTVYNKSVSQSRASKCPKVRAHHRPFFSGRN